MNAKRICKCGEPLRDDEKHLCPCCDSKFKNKLGNTLVVVIVLGIIAALACCLCG